MNNEEIIIPAFSERCGWIKEVLNWTYPRTKYSKNEIRIYESGICEIDVYDSHGKYKATSCFSECDLPTIQMHKWYQDNSGYLSTTINGEKCRLHRLLFPDTLTDHYDNDKLNNTRDNLQCTTHAINIAKIHNKTPNPHGVTGIFFTRSNTWQASIEVNGKRITKNFDNKNDAILMRYVWELNNWGINAPQLHDIQKAYPSLVSAIYKGVKINENITTVKAILKLLSEDDHCPCRVVKTPETKCMCKEFRDKLERGETGSCHCGLYISTND